MSDFSGSEGEATDTQAPPSLAVIVPAYNCEQWIGACLESVLASDYLQELFEVICVDNASTDRTPDILGEFRSRVTVLHESKRGASAARGGGAAGWPGRSPS